MFIDFMFCLFYSFLNIENTVITGLMFTSSNVVCAVSWLVLIDFSSHYGLYFLAFCIPGNFLLDARHLKFYFVVGCRIFFNLIKNIFELCFGMQLSYLETVVFSDLAFKLC